MEERYDTYIGESYAAMERTNFYDAVYSPVILILNAVVVAVVMLLSASGNHTVLTFFGMSAGTAVPLQRAWEWRFRRFSLRLPESTGSMNFLHLRRSR